MKTPKFLCYRIEEKDMEEAQRKTRLYPYPVLVSNLPESKPPTLTIRVNGVDEEYEISDISYIEGKTKFTYYNIKGFGEIISTPF